ncbi:MAG: ABC transporter ATP-binding protein [Chloroflexota bacterium]|nr:ABC transporter ATP-binding protein [Chloroflexota bacterium]
MITLENVTKIYPDGTEAVKDVSFKVSQGELCILLGTSGCGKTTTMKMINRLIPVTGGKIYIDGVEHTEANENELRRNIGYAIQDIGLFPHMTVEQNIETVPSLQGWSEARQRERAEELLQLVGLDSTEFMDKYPNECSGGQRQRVGVARALGANPPILLMDEPFGAIDPITRVTLQDEFLRIQQEIKKTIIFVTHDIYEAIKMGDKIALMNSGCLVQYDTPASLLYRPKNKFVQDFVGDDRALKGLQLIRVEEVITDDAPRAKSDEKVEVAQERMRQEGTDQLPVVNNEGKFLGWVGQADLGAEGIVEDSMQPSTVTARKNTVLNEVLSVMFSNGFKNLPIVDKHNILRGVISFDTIQRALSEAAQEKQSE